MHFSLIEVDDLPDLREIGRRRIRVESRWPKGIDPYRLQRAGALTVQPLEANGEGDYYRVEGGLEPHILWRGRDPTLIRRPASVSAALLTVGSLDQLTLSRGEEACDCGDFASGARCKHLLAVALSLNEAPLPELVTRLAAHGSESADHTLELSQLWFAR